MEIATVKGLKKELQKHLGDVLREWEVRTGVTISNLEIIRNTQLSEQYGQIVAVDVDIVL